MTIAGRAAVVIVILFGMGYVLLHVLSSAAGIDGRIYAAAARAWLSGRDPWDVRVDGLVFAAPPTDLPVGALLALLPGPWVGLGSIVFAAACAVLAVRFSNVQWWWLLAIPVLEGILVGSLDLLAIALATYAVRGARPPRPPLAAAVAVMAKLYAVVPVVVLGRRAAIVAIVVIVVATAPLLPWLEYVRRWPELATRLVEQSGDGRWSPWATPLLVPPTVAALVVLGRRDGAWLLVPALWPASQVHYGVFMLPVGSPVLLVVSLLPVPAPAAVATMALALVRAYQQRLDPWSWMPARWRS